jgi:hypothetical protein
LRRPIWLCSHSRLCRTPPNKLLPYLHNNFAGNGALAVPSWCFGNRSFDNALIELRDELEQNGFHTVAGAVLSHATHFPTSWRGAARRDDSAVMAEFFA